MTIVPGGTLIMTWCASLFVTARWWQHCQQFTNPGQFAKCAV